VGPCNTRTHSHAISTAYFRFSRKSTPLHNNGSHAVKLVAKYGEDLMKNIVFRREIVHIAQNSEIWLSRMRAKYFHFLSQTNSALKITSAISVPNLVKISEKLHRLTLTKGKFCYYRSRLH